MVRFLQGVTGLVEPVVVVHQRRDVDQSLGRKALGLGEEAIVGDAGDDSVGFLADPAFEVEEDLELYQFPLRSLGTRSIFEQ